METIQKIYLWTGNMFSIFLIAYGIFRKSMILSALGVILNVAEHIYMKQNKLEEKLK